MNLTFRLTGAMVLGLMLAIAILGATSSPAGAESREDRNQHQIDVEPQTAELDLPGENAVGGTGLDFGSPSPSGDDPSTPIDAEPQTAEIDLPGVPIDVEPQTAEIDLPGTPIDVEPQTAELDLP